MRRVLIVVALAIVVCYAPRAFAQDATPAPSVGEGKPWVRLVFIIPASVAVSAGVVYARRRFRRDT